MNADNASDADQARHATTDACDRIRLVSPDVMTAIERIEARHGSRYADCDLRTLPRTQEFHDEYRRLSGLSLFPTSSSCCSNGLAARPSAFASLS